MSSASMEFEKVAKAKRMLLNIAIGSIIMLFIAFTSAYIVSSADSFWVYIKLPQAFITSTVVIGLSSLSLFLARKMYAKQNIKASRILILLTLLLGILFSYFQFKSWTQMIDTGNYVVANMMDLKGEYGEDYSFAYQGEPVVEKDGEFYAESDIYFDRPLKDRIMGSRNSASSYIYVFSFMHWAHLLGGLLFLLSLVFKVKKHGLSPQSDLNFRQASVYWHFLGLLWAYLYSFLLFIH